jgi:hypothetical protein
MKRKFDEEKEREKREKREREREKKKLEKRKAGKSSRGFPLQKALPAKAFPFFFPFFVLYFRSILSFYLFLYCQPNSLSAIFIFFSSRSNLFFVFCF